MSVTAEEILNDLKNNENTKGLRLVGFHRPDSIQLFPSEKVEVQYNATLINDSMRHQMDESNKRSYGHFDSITWPVNNLEEGIELYKAVYFQLYNATTEIYDDNFKSIDKNQPLYLYINRIYRYPQQQSYS